VFPYPPSLFLAEKSNSNKSHRVYTLRSAVERETGGVLDDKNVMKRDVSPVSLGGDF
jgi:hypothetical protein